MKVTTLVLVTALSVITSYVMVILAASELQEYADQLQNKIADVKRTTR